MSRTCVYDADTAACGTVSWNSVAFSDPRSISKSVEMNVTRFTCDGVVQWRIRVTSFPPLAWPLYICVNHPSLFLFLLPHNFGFDYIFAVASEVSDQL